MLAISCVSLLTLPGNKEVLYWQLFSIGQHRRMDMARKRAKATQHSAVQRELRTPKYQMRVVEDKTRYKRTRDKAVRREDFRKAA